MWTQPTVVNYLYRYRERKNRNWLKNLFCSSFLAFLTTLPLCFVLVALPCFSQFPASITTVPCPSVSCLSRYPSSLFPVSITSLSQISPCLVTLPLSAPSLSQYSASSDPSLSHYSASLRSLLVSILCLSDTFLSQYSASFSSPLVSTLPLSDLSLAH